MRDRHAFMTHLETFRLSKEHWLDDPCITAGDRAYVIGTQEGAFPDMGWHVPGEMGGVWAHPIKLLDGFWLRVNGAWLEGAHRFTTGAYWSEHAYALNGGLRVLRRQFAPDGEPAIVVRYLFEAPPTIDRLRLCFLARSDLRGVWLSEQDGVVEGQDDAIYLPELGAWLCSDAESHWAVLVGARGVMPTAWRCGRDLWGPERTGGAGISVALEYELAIERRAALDFVIAGDAAGADVARASFLRVCATSEQKEEEKRTRVARMLGTNRLQVPDHAIAQAWDWAKCANDWLLRDVPGLGRGLGAGAADYVWWFGCDSCYAVRGCLGLGQHEVAKDTLDLLRERSIAVNGESGRVLHECTTGGRVFHRGCTQETPHFVTTVEQTVRWTGDRAFLERNYEFCRRGLLDWTLGEMCPDGDLLPHGYGIMEVPHLDLRCLDVAVHTVAAIRSLQSMAAAMDDLETVDRCVELEPRVRAALEDRFWIEDEGLYGDVVATPKEMLPRLRGWLDEAERSGRRATANRLRRLVEEAEARRGDLRPWYLGNWTTMAPIEAGLAPPDRALRALARIEEAFNGPWGVYVNAFDGEIAMSINTGALAVAELAYGRADKALGYMQLLAAGLELRTPGAISEIAPDQGCFVQAWSAYGLVWPVVSQIFGAQPDALRHRLDVLPAFPSSWSTARLENVRIGGTTCALAWDGRRLRVTLADPSWTVSSPGDVPIEVSHGSGREVA